MRRILQEKRVSLEEKRQEENRSCASISSAFPQNTSHHLRGENIGHTDSEIKVRFQE